MSGRLVYRPYHVITTHKDNFHVVNSRGEIVNRFKLPQTEQLRFFQLPNYRFAIFFATLGRMDRQLTVYESTTDQPMIKIKDIPMDTSVLSMIQLRGELQQIVVLTVARGLLLFDGELEFEQRVEHPGIVVECLHQLPEGSLMTATNDFCLHVWHTKTWIELRSINLLSDEPPFQEFKTFVTLHRIKYVRESLFIVITDRDYAIYDLESNEHLYSLYLHQCQERDPIVLNNLIVYRHHGTAIQSSKQNVLFRSMQLNSAWGLFHLRDGRFLLEADELSEIYVNPDNSQMRVGHRNKLNDFRLIFAMFTKQDDDLFVSRLEPLIKNVIPILDLRMIVYDYM